MYKVEHTFIGHNFIWVVRIDHRIPLAGDSADILMDFGQADLAIDFMVLLGPPNLPVIVSPHSCCQLRSWLVKVGLRFSFLLGCGGCFEVNIGFGFSLTASALSMTRSPLGFGHMASARRRLVDFVRGGCCGPTLLHGASARGAFGKGFASCVERKRLPIIHLQW